MLYYDFGFRSDGYTHPTLGNWGTHDYLFISRYDGKILKTIAVPPEVPVVTDIVGKGEITHTEWEHPEWSNHPYFAAASILVRRTWHKDNRPGQTMKWQHRSRNERIFGINLKEKSFTELIASNDSSFAAVVNFLHPWLWVEKETNFAEDVCWLVPPDSSCSSSPVREHNAQPDRKIALLYSNGILRVHSASATLQPDLISVHTVDGKSVFHGYVSRNKNESGIVELTHLRSGVYIVSIQLGTNLFSQKIAL